MAEKMKIEGIDLRAWCIGIIVTVIASIGIVMMLSGLVVNSTIGESNAYRFTTIALLLSSFLGGITVRFIGDPMNLYMPISVNAVYYCVLLLAGMLLFDGSVQNALLSLGAVGVGCTLACLIKRKKKRKHTNRTRRSR